MLKMKYQTNQVICALMMSALLASGAIAQDPKEQELGRKYHQELSKQYKVTTDPRLTEIGRKVSQVVGVNHVNFYAIDMGKDDQANAFQIPGHIYATRTLLKEFDDISLTFIMGHELGHEIKNHGRKQSRRNQNVGLGAVLLGTILGVDSRSVGGLAISIAGGAIVNQYSREQEEEADLFGLNVLHDLGIPFTRAAQAFEQLGGGRSENPTLNTLFGSHPMMKERVKRTGSAEDWLQMRDVDIVVGDRFHYSLVWPYTGDKQDPADIAKLKQDTLAALRTQGWKDYKQETDIRAWTKLARFEMLKPNQAKAMHDTLGVQRVLIAEKLSKDRWTGYIYDGETGKRARVGWKFKSASELAGLINEVLKRPVIEFEDHNLPG